MAEEQDWDVPDSLRSSIYAVYAQGSDIYEMYESLWIPSKYTDAIDEMWESWVEEDKKNPPEPGVARMIPTEWPGFDSDETDEDQAAYEVLLDKFRRRFGHLYWLYQMGTPREAAVEIESIYLEFSSEKSISEDFNGFLKSSQNYLRIKGMDAEIIRIFGKPAGSEKKNTDANPGWLSQVRERTTGTTDTRHPKPPSHDESVSDEEKK